MKRLLATLLAWIAFSAAGQGAAPTPPPIAARAYYVFDTLSGQALATAAENEPFEPASLS